jgi:hypothetical protein
LLIEILRGRLQRCDGLRHLLLLAGELILIGCELLFALPDKCGVNRHRFLTWSRHLAALPLLVKLEDSKVVHLSGDSGHLRIVIRPLTTTSLG